MTDTNDGRPALRGAFRIVAIACAAFLALTIAAMLLYPGGRVGDRNSAGYSFFTNFFSDLGQTQTHSGASNLPSLVLFCIALGAIAIGLPVFFFAFARLFAPGSAARRWADFAALVSIVTSISFLGVAATPWNLYLSAHNDFVTWAFRSLLVAISSTLAATVLERALPRTFAAVFAAFAVVLLAYVVLIAAGPAPSTAGGAAIQATGQKVIVYASVLTA